MSEIGKHGRNIGQQAEANAGSRAQPADGHLEKGAHSAIVDNARWGILALLFLSITINLLDRQVLSVMAPMIRDELRLSNTEYSYIVFAFTLGLTLAQAPAGMWLDRRGPRWGLPVIMAIWSAANASRSTVTRSFRKPARSRLPS